MGVLCAAVMNGKNECDNVSSSNDLKSYWDVVNLCSPCLTTKSCGFCHSTMQCQEGDEYGPFKGPCPAWISEQASCPRAPQCSTLADCNSCAGANDCAWCSSQSLCLTMEETYTAQCRGIIYDTPCMEYNEKGKMIVFLIDRTYDLRLV